MSALTLVEQPKEDFRGVKSRIGKAMTQRNCAVTYDNETQNWRLTKR